jgi:hypothetical protein
LGSLSSRIRVVVASDQCEKQQCGESSRKYPADERFEYVMFASHVLAMSHEKDSDVYYRR